MHAVMHTVNRTRVLAFGCLLTLWFSAPALAQPSFDTTYQTVDFSGEWSELAFEGSFQYEWILHISEVTDPENLRQPFVQSSHFKKLPAGAPFTPESCSAR